MAESSDRKAPWQESIWVQSSRPKDPNFDSRLEEALREVEQKPKEAKPESR